MWTPYTSAQTPTFANERSIGFDTVCSLSIDGGGDRTMSSFMSSSSTSSGRKHGHGVGQGEMKQEITYTAATLRTLEKLENISD